ncbi:diversity-generating retroelement protein Avd [Vibrio parahaemolyticus]|uniref:diversity-generating retroelement protein Avd n=1 Tax=Vibrio parahaemolyticus TaxID=670 RepID=UPI0004E7943A|nr:diversity-generating retroelement protein Avd [Vibrio parahaemolyticus]KFE96092.1 S23 ribosomal protein [Vibrio parahaemolyticus]MBX5339491.1 diversity-generating retroelement protein Avd [Vibrio parahaemolyticus]
MNDELAIQTKTRDMMGYGFICLRQFPKSERFILCADIRRSMYTMLRLTVVASKRYHKKTTIQDLDIELAMLKNMIRVSYDLHYIDIRKYELWSRHLAEIGRMVGGWLKSVSK